MEMEKVPQAGYEIEGLDIAGLNRSSLIKNIGLPTKLLKSFFQVRKIFKSFQPDAVIGVGGYSSFPVLRFAQAKGIPSFIHESNSFAGKSNIDSNYWARPIDDNVVFKTLQGIKNQNFNLQQLRMYSGFDISSNKSTKLIKDESDLRFEYNPSPHRLVVNLNEDYISMDGKVYHKKIILLLKEMKI